MSDQTPNGQPVHVQRGRTFEQRILEGNLDQAYDQAIDLACVLAEIQYTARKFLRPSDDDGNPPITAATAGLILVEFVCGWRWGRTVFMLPSSGNDKVLAAELRKVSMALASARQGRRVFGHDSAGAYLCQLEDIVGSRLARSVAAQPLCRLIVRRTESFPGSWRSSDDAFPLGGNDPELKATARQADVKALARLVRDNLDGYGSENVMRELKSEFTSAAAFRVAHGVKIIVGTAANAELLPRPAEPPKPRWDRKGRELWLGELLLKRYTRNAERQERILDGFEKLNWAQHLYDPFQEGKLSEVLDSLNSALKKTPLRFRGDGTGTGLCWELKRDITGS